MDSKGPTPPSKRGGMSLYADLVEKEGVSTTPQDSKKNEPDNAALKFQPAHHRRPNQRPSQKPKSAPRQTPAFTSSINSGDKLDLKSNITKITSEEIPVRETDEVEEDGEPDKGDGIERDQFSKDSNAQQRLKHEDWVSRMEDDEDVNEYYGIEKPERGGRKKRKKQKEKDWEYKLTQAYWDEPFDPTEKLDLEAYRQSECKMKHDLEYKQWLMSHGWQPKSERGVLKKGQGYSDEDEEDEGEARRSRRQLQNRFAPPPELTKSVIPIAQPTSSPPSERSEHTPEEEDEEMFDAPEPVPEPAFVHTDATGEDAYLRRLQMSGMAPTPPQPDHGPETTETATPSIRVEKVSHTENLPGLEIDTIEPTEILPPDTAPSQPLSPPNLSFQPTVESEPESGPSPSRSPSQVTRRKKPLEEGELEEPTVIEKGPVLYNRATSTAKDRTKMSGTGEDDELEAALADIKSSETSEGVTAATTSANPVLSTDAQPQAQQKETSQNTTQQPQQAQPPPKKKRFGSTLMEKMGWTPGTSLGQHNSGIIEPLRLESSHTSKSSKKKPRTSEQQQQKQQQSTHQTMTMSTASGAGIGRIVGGRRSKTAVEEEKQRQQAQNLPGGDAEKMSNVIKLTGMLNGVPLEKMLSDGSLVQGIGDECASKYGRVERIYIPRDIGEDGNYEDEEHENYSKTSDSTRRKGEGKEEKGAEGEIPIFIKFTDTISAFRALKDLNGRKVNKGVVSGRYWDGEDFENGVFA